MRTRRWTTVMAGVLGVGLPSVLFTSGCTPDAAGAPREVVRIAISEPAHLLPSRTTDPGGTQVLAALFSPLVAYDDENQPYEVAAESVATSDNTTWTIKLKPDFTFHNGEKVTADSYIDAWNYAAYGKNGQENSYFFDRIDGFAALNPDASEPTSEAEDAETETEAETEEASALSGLKKVDDLTITVRLSSAFGGFRTMLGSPAFYPLPEAAFDSDGTLRADFGQAPVGNGPFRIKGTWHGTDPIEVERYDGYPGTQPKVRGAIFKVYDQPSTSYADLIAGNIDVITQVPAASVATARTTLGDRYGRRAGAELNFLAFPAYDEELSKPDVRRAISMAIDRDQIAESLFDGAQPAARSFVGPVVPGYREDSCGPACQFDPDKAKQLYADAGGPAQLRITYNTDGGHKAWVDAVCAQLAANLGVTCAGVAEPTFAAIAGKLRDKQPVGMFRMRSVMNYPSMADYLAGLYSTPGASNYFGYSNPRFDQLVREGDAARKTADAVSKYQQAEDILADDMPVIPLRFGQADFAYSQRVRAARTDLFNLVDLTAIELSD